SPLKPRVLIRRVIHDQLDHDLQIARMRGSQECLKVLHRPIARMYVQVVGDIVAVVTKGRRIKRKEPDASYAEVLEIIEFADEALKVADAIVVRIGEGPDVQLIDDGILIPERVGGAAGSLHFYAPLRRRRMCAGTDPGVSST